MRNLINKIVGAYLKLFNFVSLSQVNGILKELAIERDTCTIFDNVKLNIGFSLNSRKYSVTFQIKKRI